MKPKLLITLPCFNEELILEKNFQIIKAFAELNLLKYDWHILIIDNASDDKTYEIAKKLQVQFLELMVSQCLKKGRGVALNTTWLNFPGYDVYSYFDIDLATDMKDYHKLLSAIENGDHIAIGSRYVSGSDIKRSPKREFLSRIYNGLLRMFFGVRFLDAQCGFKAFHGPSLPVLLAKTKDPGWFWDTEIMIHAQNCGYTVREIPVSWREIRDELRQSKVSPFQEVARQLKNIAILKWRLLNNGS